MVSVKVISSWESLSVPFSLVPQVFPPLDTFLTCRVMLSWFFMFLVSMLDCIYWGLFCCLIYFYCYILLVEVVELWSKCVEMRTGLQKTIPLSRSFGIPD